MFNIELFFEQFKSKKGFALLIDPDKVDDLDNLKKNAIEAGVDFFLVGSSYLSDDRFEQVILKLKESSNIPVIIFPGNSIQVSKEADGLLFLSLLSGRNPQFLIGEHVVAAPRIKLNNIQTIPTSYLLIDSGKMTAVEFMSNTKPIPADKPELVVAHALASQYLGMKLIYLEGGSGAKIRVNDKIIYACKNSVDVPIIVGGGLRSVEDIKTVTIAGADIVVVGNHFEKKENLNKLKDFVDAVHN